MGDFHWKDGWMFARKADGIRIYNDTCHVDMLIPYAEWLSILRVTDSTEEAIKAVLKTR